MKNAEVVVVSRGDDMSVVLTSLIAQQGPWVLRLVVDRLPGTRDALLLDTLRRLGWQVSVHLQRHPGIGWARVDAGEFCTSDYLISLDDDAVLVPEYTLDTLCDQAESHAFACPIIRYACNFTGTDIIPEHEEIWEEVDKDDPRVQRAVSMNGEDWMRVYDIGHNQNSTDMGGTAFAVRTEWYREAAKGLAGWTAGGEDRYIGTRLADKHGPGVILSGIYAYHVGQFSLHKWGMDTVGHRLCREDPEEFRKYATS